MNTVKATLTLSCIFALAISCSSVKQLPVTIDTSGVSFNPKLKFNFDTTAPTFERTEPTTLQVNIGAVTIAGIVRDDVEVAKVLVNGEQVTLEPAPTDATEGYAARFSTTVNLTEGEHKVRILVSDTRGNEQPVELNLTATAPTTTPPPVATNENPPPQTQPSSGAPSDTIAPTIEITEPEQLEAPVGIVTIAGNAQDNVKVKSVVVNGKTAYPGARPLRLEAVGTHTVQFRSAITLTEGRNTISIVAVDTSGNETTEMLTLTGRRETAAVRATGDTETTGQRWALLVGVDRYEKNQQGDYFLPNLKACVKDVTALDTVFRNAERGGFEHVTTLVSNDTADESDDPTNWNILDALENLVQRTEENDLVVIYFSGHGWQSGDEAYLLPQNFNVKYPDQTAIRSADLTKMINQMDAKKVVTILDACHSGGIEVRPQGGKAGGTKVTLNKRYQEAFSTSEGKVVLHSCDADEKSWELADSSQGVFSKYLVDGLHGAADAEGDKNGVITIQEAYSYASKQVRSHMKQDGRGLQTPVMTGKLIGEIPLTIDPPRKAQHQLETQQARVFELIHDVIVADRAISLLNKRAEKQALTENEERLLNYLDNLLAGKISADTYLGADKQFGQ
jgi:uncharacterized caspase-like protein